MNTGERPALVGARDGRDSPYASWFDIDWDGGKLALPVLGDDTEPVVDGDLLRYHEHTFPPPRPLPARRLARGARLPALLRRVHPDRAAGRGPGGVPRHARGDLLAARRGAGRRAADRPPRRARRPARLPRPAARRSGGVWTVVEKILDRRRAAAGRLGVRRHHRLRGAQPGQRAVRRPGGQDAADRAVQPADRRARRLPARGHAGQARGHRPVLRRRGQRGWPRAAACPPARRSPNCSPRCRSTGPTWCRASRRRPSPSRSSKPPPPPALPDAAGPSSEQVLYGPAEVVTRFQQTCGPVMAKGVEDTALYRWFPLSCLNEVGGEPDRFGVSRGGVPPVLHGDATGDDDDAVHPRHQTVGGRTGPAGRAVGDAAGVGRGGVAVVGGASASTRTSTTSPGRTSMAAWPISADRLADYLLKAAREAKTAISWVRPRPRLREGLRDFVTRPSRSGCATWPASPSGSTPFARSNSLAPELVQLMMPGVPDVYQGNEMTDFSLVDPDNRRPVNFGLRRGLLAASALVTAPMAAVAPRSCWSPAALRLRRRLWPRPAPVHAAAGARRRRPSTCVAVRPAAAARSRVATRLPVRLAAAAAGATTALALRPGARWTRPAHRLPHGRWPDLPSGADLLGQHPRSHCWSRDTVTLLEV